MVGQWFVRRIDAAMAIYSVVMSIGFMIAFPAVGAAVQSRGWRAAWFAAGAAIIAVLLPLALLLVRRSPESMGLIPDGANAEPGTAQQGTRTLGTRNPEPGSGTPESAGFTLSEAPAPLPFGSSPSARRSMGSSRRASASSTNQSLAERGLGPNIYYQTLVVTR